MPRFSSISELDALVGTHLGHGDWLTITQERIDLFADATDDHQWIHVDPARAAEGPFGSTVAHGFLTLSLIPVLTTGVLEVDGLQMEVNYGLNKVRFTSAVRAGARVRAALDLVELRPGGSGTQVVLGVRVEVEGEERPAVVAEWILLLVP